MLIFKLLKARKMYKDGKLVYTDTAAGVSEIAFDVVKPFAVLATIGLGFVTLLSLLFGYIVVHIGFLKPIFWIAFILLILLRLVVMIIKKVLHGTSEVVVTESVKIGEGLRNKFHQ